MALLFHFDVQELMHAGEIFMFIAFIFAATTTAVEDCDATTVE
jgi:hypothetical protein